MMKSIIALLILVLFLEVAICRGTSYPEIIEVLRTPVDPPPGVSVNVTCMIQDRYGLVNVSLLFSVNNGTYDVSKMQIVDGDFYNGTFYAQIPGQPIDTIIEYYAVASDSIGYVAQSPNYVYQVSYDKTGPITVDVARVKPLGSPVLPTEEVEIEATIADLGSGVKNATLFFGAGEDPFEIDYNQTSMKRIAGTDYNCTFLGTIPSYPNGTRVYYFVGATDNANNTAQQNERTPYFVAQAPSSWLQITNINVLTVDLNNLTATINMRFDAELPSQNEPDNFVVQITNGYGNERLVDSPLYVSINSSSFQRYSYGGTVISNFHLIGYPNRYPYDSYFLNLTCLVYWSQPASINFGGAYFGDYRLFNVWGNAPESDWHNTTDKRGYPVIITTLTVNRDNSNVFPITLLITVLFFVLGGTMLIDPAKKLSERITVFLAILVFAASFFFSLGSMVPYRLGFTTAELLILMLVVGCGTFTLASFLSNAFTQWFGSETQISGMVTDTAATTIFFLLSWGILAQIPLSPYGSLMIVAIWHGLILRLVIHLTRKSFQQDRVVSTDNLHKHQPEVKKLVESLDGKEKEKLRIERLLGEISAQASSTLVVSTVASSLSLAILTTLMGKSFDERWNWGFFAALFALLGFLYRELTIHWSLISKYRKLNKKLPPEVGESSYSLPTYIRMVIVRLFLLLPFAVFSLLLAPSYAIISGVGIIALSFAFSMGELVRRVDC